MSDFEKVKRQPEESFIEYQIRIGRDRELLHLNWGEISALCNSQPEVEDEYTESKWRKDIQAYLRVYDHLANKDLKPMSPEDNYRETTEILKDGSRRSDKLLRMSDKQSKDPDYLLEAHGYDKSEWEVQSAKSSIWNQHNKQDGTITLYSSKITVKPKTDEFSVSDTKGFFKDLYKNYKPKAYKPVQYNEDGKMLELNIADLHLGKLCWVGDSGDHYDVEVAEKRFFDIIFDVLTRTNHYKFNKILFVWSNDFYHFDGENKSTTSGTPQDTNIQFHQLYKLGNKILIDTIELLKKIAPVHTFYIGSNHDKMTSYFAVENLKTKYENDSKVTVDADPKIRKYIEFGQCLIGFSHGHAEKKRLGKVMPIEAREAWGRTKYHEIHCGHFHSEQVVKEENGTIVRYLPSVTGTDKWHFESGFVGAVKKAQSFVWDKDEGLLDIINTNVS